MQTLLLIGIMISFCRSFRPNYRTSLRFLSALQKASTTEDPPKLARKSLLVSIRSRIAAKGLKPEASESPVFIDTAPQPLLAIASPPPIKAVPSPTPADAKPPTNSLSAAKRAKALATPPVLTPEATPAIRIPKEPVEEIFQPAEEALVFNEFSRLGLLNDIVKGVAAQGFTEPTPVQKAVIPRLIAHENLVMAASTGSGDPHFPHTHFLIPDTASLPL